MSGMGEAGAKDLPTVLALYAQFDIDAGKCSICSRQARLRRFVADRDRRHPFSARRTATVVESWALLVMHNHGNFGAASAVAENVVAEPAHRGRGVGQTMQHALGKARRLGSYEVALCCNRKRHRALTFHQPPGSRRHDDSILVELDGAGQ